MGVDGFYKSSYLLNHPRCTDRQCLEQQQLASISGLKDPIMIQDLNTIQEPTSRQTPQFPENSDSFRGLEDSAERAARIVQFLEDIEPVGAQENVKEKRNKLNDGYAHDSSTVVSNFFFFNISTLLTRGYPGPNLNVI